MKRSGLVRALLYSLLPRWVRVRRRAENFYRLRVPRLRLQWIEAIARNQALQVVADYQASVTTAPVTTHPQVLAFVEKVYGIVLQEQLGKAEDRAEVAALVESLRKS